ncbi:sensor histidine kinase [Pseudonocardia sp. CA-107938]|uniref:sensor histidine kinase n=1 Tax=Pseudonocardia sp. CA-107938 TaxID=3240021 RepID=UPI003D8C2A47
MAEPGPDFRHLTRPRWYVVAGGWALVLTVPTIVAATSMHPQWQRVLLTLGVLAYALLYVFGLYEAMFRDRTGWWSAGLVLAMGALWTTMAVEGTGVIALSFLVVSVLAVLPKRWGGLAAVLTAVAAAGFVWLVRGTLELGDLIGMAAITMAQIGMFGLIRINSELRAAREELARLAVTAERERMARDLHDVLGHSLTTITVKAALARRLLEHGEHDRAAVEVTDVETLGRQALADVRSTVAANRVASLPREIATGREALRAAGITAEMPVAVDDVPADRQHAFAYVLREGVTNVIRHSGASTVTVRLSPESIEIVDDGVGSPAGTPSGNGLRGLAERVAAVGGWVDAGPTPSGGYRLRAEVAPAPKGALR